MLTAKMLGALAGAFAVLALLQGVRRGSRAFDLYFHDTYLVFAPSHFFLLCAFGSAIFAVLYFVVSRWTTHPPNRSVGFVSAGLLLVSILILFGSSFSTLANFAYSELYFVFAILGFLLALGLLSANLALALAWTLFDKARNRPSFH